MLDLLSGPLPWRHLQLTPTYALAVTTRRRRQHLPATFELQLAASRTDKTVRPVAGHILLAALAAKNALRGNWTGVVQVNHAILAAPHSTVARVRVQVATKWSWMTFYCGLLLESFPDRRARASIWYPASCATHAVITDWPLFHMTLLKWQVSSVRW